MSSRQSSYDIVRKSIELEYPERIPVRSHSHREEGQKAIHFGDTFDIHSLDTDTRGWELGMEGEDEWGCVWQHSKDKNISNIGYIVFHPLYEWNNMAAYKFPDSNDMSRYARIERPLSEVGDKYVLIYKHSLLFERMWFLRGLNNLMQDFLLEPKKVHELADKIVEFDLDMIRNLKRLFKGRIHGLWTTDDWGTQNGMMIGIPMWREFFKRRYKAIFDEIHSAGMHVWLHSCGKINDVIDEFISVGVDVINTFQPTLLGIEEIKNRFVGRVCFETCVDIQKTLPFGSDEDIREEIKMLVEKCRTPKGGLIICDYGEGRMIGVPDGKKQIMFNALKELEKTP
jgi:uroporphyrinogen decarboxylase